MRPWEHVEVEESPEGTTVVIRGTIEDHSDPPVALGAADLDTLEAWIYDRGDPELVATGWDGRDVKEAGGGTFHPSTKEFTLRIGPDDMAMFNGLRRREVHVLKLRWTYNGGADAQVQLISLPIHNLPALGPSS